MEDNGLPAVGQLEATPEILRGLMRELTEEDARPQNYLRNVFEVRPLRKREGPRAVETL